MRNPHIASTLVNNTACRITFSKLPGPERERRLVVLAVRMCDVHDPACPECGCGYVNDSGNEHGLTLTCVDCGHTWLPEPVLIPDLSDLLIGI